MYDFQSLIIYLTILIIVILLLFLYTYASSNGTYIPNTTNMDKLAKDIKILSESHEKSLKDIMEIKIKEDMFEENIDEIKNFNNDMIYKIKDLNRHVDENSTNITDLQVKDDLFEQDVEFIKSDNNDVNLKIVKIDDSIKTIGSEQEKLDITTNNHQMLLNNKVSVIMINEFTKQYSSQRFTLTEFFKDFKQCLSDLSLYKKSNLLVIENVKIINNSNNNLKFGDIVFEDKTNQHELYSFLVKKVESDILTVDILIFHDMNFIIIYDNTNPSVFPEDKIVYFRFQIQNRLTTDFRFRYNFYYITAAEKNVFEGFDQKQGFISFKNDLYNHSTNYVYFVEKILFLSFFNVTEENKKQFYSFVFEKTPQLTGCFPNLLFKGSLDTSLSGGNLVPISQYLILVKDIDFTIYRTEVNVFDTYNIF